VRVVAWSADRSLDSSISRTSWGESRSLRIGTSSSLAKRTFTRVETMHEAGPSGTPTLVDTVQQEHRSSMTWAAAAGLPLPRLRDGIPMGAHVVHGALVGDGAVDAAHTEARVRIEEWPILAHRYGVCGPHS
jgi:hypothetical protein